MKAVQHGQGALAKGRGGAASAHLAAAVEAAHLGEEAARAVARCGAPRGGKERRRLGLVHPPPPPRHRREAVRGDQRLHLRLRLGTQAVGLEQGEGALEHGRRRRRRPQPQLAQLVPQLWRATQLLVGQLRLGAGLEHRAGDARSALGQLLPRQLPAQLGRLDLERRCQQLRHRLGRLCE